MKTDDRTEIEGLIAVDERALARLRDEGRLTERPLAVYGAHAEIALLRHALGDVAGSRGAFVEAGRWAVAAYERNEPTTALRGRTPRELIDAAMLVAAFGTMEERRRLAALPRGAWYLPESPHWAATAIAAELLLEWLGGRATGDDARAAWTRLGEIGNADPIEVGWAEHLVAGLVGIADRDVAEVLADVSQLLFDHHQRACIELNDGGSRDLPESFVALWATGLTALATEVGIDIRCRARTVPEAAMDLRLDRAWCGPYPDVATARAAADATLAAMGYAPADDGDGVLRTVNLVALGGEWWLEADSRVARSSATAGRGQLHEIHAMRLSHARGLRGTLRTSHLEGGSVVPEVEQALGDDALDGATTIEAVRRHLASRVGGGDPTLGEVESLRYIASPVLGDAALDRAIYGMREADKHEVLVALEPVHVRTERLGGAVQELWVIPTRDDWKRIEAALG